jgi:hypothetical protein
MGVGKQLARAGVCSVCGRQQPGMASARYPGLVRLDLHLHPVPYLGFCIGSRSHFGPRGSREDSQ